MMSLLSAVYRLPSRRFCFLSLLFCLTGYGCQTLAQDLSFPRLTATTLTDLELTLPDDLTTVYSLLFIPLQQNQDVSFSSWESYAKELEQQNPDLGFLQLILIGDVNFFLKGIISSGLKSSYDDTVKSRTLPVFTDTAPFLSALAIASDAEMVVLLLDGERVIWRTTGDWSPEKATELEAQMQSLRPD